MPSNSNPIGALPSRFRRQRVLVIGCGDVGLRVAGLLPRGTNIMALTSSASRLTELRARGITPLLGNLDNKASLGRLAGLATRLVHLAPPPNDQQAGRQDRRTRGLLQVLRLRSLPQSVVYGSTSGVYGNGEGAWVHETRQLNPQTARAWRRVDAEAELRLFGRATATPLHILRIPGIYAPNREGGTPRTRLLKGSPVLLPEDDVYTNHIHADDLARACLAALWRGKPQRVTHVSDDTELKMGDYFDLAADLYGLPRPPRLARREAQACLPAMQLSFMAESRRLDNRRLKDELKSRLQYPTVRTGLCN
ncbi:MAG: SDR family oxidoreductase [Pseudomonadota bacterium]